MADAQKSPVMPGDKFAVERPYDPNNDSSEEGNAESYGGDHRQIQDNGVQGHNSYQMGQPSGNSFPPYDDPQAGEDTNGNAEMSDFGWNETKDVGFDPNQTQYGIEGRPAGGGNKRNTMV